MIENMEAKIWETTAIEKKYEVTNKDLVKKKVLTHGAWLSPVLLSTIPASIFFVLFLIFGVTPPAAATFIFFGLISLVVGFLFGLIVSGGLLIYRQKWLAELREKLAVDGIKTEEVEWFRHELTSPERKALKEIEAENRLLGDAYRETLASRLTASRIVKSTRSELQLVKRREGKLKVLKSEASKDLQEVLQNDREKLEKIRQDAEQMKIEAETRLQMIEAASRRGTNVADTELALQKLTARSIELPLALEALKIEEEIRKELEEGDKRLEAKGEEKLLEE